MGSERRNDGKGTGFARPGGGGGGLGDAGASSGLRTGIQAGNAGPRPGWSLRSALPGPYADGSSGLTSTYKVGERGVEEITFDGSVAHVRGTHRRIMLAGGWVADLR